MIYTVAEFRKKLREAFNDVEAGKLVVIVRHGKEFVLTTTKHWNDKQLQAQRGAATLITDKVSENIRPDIVGVDPAHGDDYSAEARWENGKLYQKIGDGEWRHIATQKVEK